MENTIKNKSRNSSIELLRIIAQIGVVIGHYNVENIGGAFKYVLTGSINEYYLKFIESSIICVVNLFIFISAYFLAKSDKRKLSKVVALIIQVIIFRIFFYVLACVIGEKSFSFINLLFCFLPNNYYVILYSVLYIVSPYLNKLFKMFNKKQFLSLTLICFIIFSVLSYGVDCLNVVAEYFGFSNLNGMSTISSEGSIGGYTIVNFILIYMIAAYFSLNNIKISMKKSLTIYLISIVFIFIISLFNWVAYQFNNPFAITATVGLFFIFNNINFNSKIIDELAKAAFTCFLFHSQLIRSIGIEYFVTQNVLILLVHQVISVITLFLLSYPVFKIYDLLTHKGLKILGNRIDCFDIYYFDE